MVEAVEMVVWVVEWDILLWFTHHPCLRDILLVSVCKIRVRNFILAAVVVLVDQDPRWVVIPPQA